MLQPAPSSGPDPDALLARYRAEGRPGDLAALFDAAAPELFRLALHLCPDAASAEDVLQETFVAVIECSSVYDPGRRAMPWLTGILKNQALMARRRAARRPDPGRLDMPAAPEDPAFGAADAEERRLVQEAMEDLPEPLRGVALLRWRYGMEPSAIAHVKGVPPGTVRSWLHRALGRLKVEMGAMPALLLAFRPERGLDGVRTALLRRAAAKAAAAAAASSTAAALGGLLVTHKLLAAACALLLLAGIGWMAARTHGNPGTWAESTDTAAAPPRSGPVGTGVPGVPAGTEASSDSLPSPVDFAALDRDRDLHGVVVRRDGTPVAGATLRAVRYPWSRAFVFHEAGVGEPVAGATTLSAVDGTFAMRLERGALVALRVSRAGLAPEEVPQVQAGERVRVVLLPAVRLLVGARDERGDPLPGTRWGLQHFSPERELVLDRRAEAGGDGVAAFDDLPSGSILSIALLSPTGYADPARIVMPASGEARLDLVVHPGSTVRGRVTDAATGRPLAGARVGWGWDLAREARSGEDGSFTLGGTQYRHGAELHCLADGHARGVVAVGEGRDVADFSLERGFALRGRVVAAGGIPLGDARLSALGGEWVAGSLRRSLGHARTGADGRFSISGLDPGTGHVLTVVAEGAGRSQVEVPPAGPEQGEVDIGDVVLPQARAIEGRVVSPEGEPLARRSLSLRGPGAPVGGDLNGGPGCEETRPTDDLGRFRFPDLAPGTYTMETSAPGIPGTSVQVVLPPDRDVTDLVVRAEPTRELTVRVVDEAGGPVPGAEVCVNTPSGSGGVATTGPDGVARVRTSVREFDVSVLDVMESLSGRTYLHAERQQVEAGGPAERTFVLKEGATVSGTVLDAEGKPLPGVVVQAMSGERPVGVDWSAPDGRFRALVPLRGMVDLVVDGMTRVESRVVDLLVEGRLEGVSPGTGDAVIRCLPVKTGRTLTLRITAPDGSPLEGIAVMVWSMAGGGSTKVATDAEGKAFCRDLTSRRLRVLVHPRDPWLEPRPVEVVPAGQEVSLVMRASSRISGTVVRPDGTPVPRAVVVRAADGELGLASFAGMADERGQFSVLVPEAATNEFTLEVSGADGEGAFRGSARGVRAGDTNVRIAIER